MRWTIGKISMRVVLYLLISLFLFLNFVNLVQFPKSESLLEQNAKVEKIGAYVATINMKEVVLADIKGVKKEFNFSKTAKNFSQQFVFFDYLFKNNNVVIPLIYILTMITFLLQAILLALSNYYEFLTKYISEKKLDNLFLYSSEWAVNAPPVLGVVGTIFSFGMVVSNMADMSSLSTVFKENFSNAALTTILGGSMYVLNLLINIFIAKNLAK